MVGVRPKTGRDRQDFLEKIKELEDFDSWPKAQQEKTLKKHPNGIESLRMTLKLNHLSKHDDAEGAVEWYKNHKTKKLLASQYCSLIRIFSESDVKYRDVFEEALEAAEKLEKKNEGIFSLAVRGYSNWLDDKNTLVWLEKLKAAGFEPRLRTYTPVITVLSKTVTLETLKEFQKQYSEMRVIMKKRDTNLTIVEFTDMLTGIFRIYKTIKKTDKTTLKEVEGFFNKVLFGLGSENIIPDDNLKELLIEWFKLKNYKVTPSVKIGVDGKCKCRLRLIQRRLAEEHKQQVSEKVDKLVSSQPALVGEWEFFKGWLKTREAKLKSRSIDPNVDVVIDAANVAYYKMMALGRMFRFDSINLITKELEKRNLSYLIVLHQSHTSKRDCSHPDDRDLLNKWRRDYKICIVPRHHNDDWYWLYIAMTQKKDAFILSNDEMRDHHFMMLRQKTFHHWKTNHQIYFSAYVDKQKRCLERIHLDFPGRYTMSVQIHFRDKKNVFSTRYGKQPTVGSKRGRDSDSKSFKINYIQGDYIDQKRKKIECIHIPSYLGPRPKEALPGQHKKYTSKPINYSVVNWTCIDRPSSSSK